MPLRDGFADAWESVTESLPKVGDFPAIPIPEIPLPNLQLPRIDVIMQSLPPGVDPVTFLRVHFAGGVSSLLGAMDHIRASLPLRGAMIAGGGGQRAPWMPWPQFLQQASWAAQDGRAGGRASDAFDEAAPPPPSAADLDAIEADLRTAWRARASGQEPPTTVRREACFACLHWHWHTPAHAECSARAAAVSSDDARCRSTSQSGGHRLHRNELWLRQRARIAQFAVCHCEMPPCVPKHLLGSKHVAVCEATVNPRLFLDAG